MSQMLDDFLRGPQLTKLIGSEVIKPGIANLLPPEFTTPSLTKPDCMTAEWDEISGNREGAPLSSPDAPAKNYAPAGVQPRKATCIVAKEMYTLPQELMLALQSDNPAVVTRAQDVIIRNLSMFRLRFDTTKLQAIYSLLAKGTIYADVNGNILPNSTGNVLTIPCGTRITKGKTDQVNGFAVGDWSSASVSIKTSMVNIISDCMKTTGYRPGYAFYGQNILEYILANTSLKEYLKMHPGFVAQLVEGREIPPGFLGVAQWIPVENAINVLAGVATSWFGAKQILFMPAVTPMTYELIEGASLIPNGLGTPNMTMDQMTSLCTRVNGYFSYATMSINPLAASIIAGWAGLPVNKIPGATYDVDVAT